MDLKRLAVCLSLGQQLYGSDGTVITQPQHQLNVRNKAEGHGLPGHHALVRTSKNGIVLDSQNLHSTAHTVMHQSVLLHAEAFTNHTRVYI